MTGQDLFRCDYCGQLSDLDDAVIFWTEVDELENDRRLYVPAVYCGAYCGAYCGRTATSRSGTGRG